ncbi:MAG: hypothetical protein CM15mP25_0360 [Gammaproteobacteria bacterium]|nr:MAG: hypothetical protein CM15mP25_0360 [Gammaproteobacteria bacterium]
MPEARRQFGNTLKSLVKIKPRREASYRQAIALNPDYAEARSNLGVTLKNQGRLGGGSSRLCLKAIALEAGYAEAHYNLTKHSKSTGAVREAEAAYRTAIALEKDFAAAHE